MSIILRIIFLFTLLSSIAFAHIKILPLGDSLTWGITGYKELMSGYRDPLYRLIEKSGYDIQYIGVATSSSTPYLQAHAQESHAGFPGYRIDQLDENFDGDLNVGNGNAGGYWLTGKPGMRDALYPDIILLMAGSNDIFQYPNADVAILRMRHILDKIFELRPQTTVIVTQIPPIFFPNFDPFVREYNQKIRELVQTLQNQQRKIALADMYTPLADKPLAFPDKIHPDSAGYAVMANQWMIALEPILKTISSS